MKIHYLSEGSKRQGIKTLIRCLKRDNPNIKKSICNRIHAAFLNTIPGYKVKRMEYAF